MRMAFDRAEEAFTLKFGGSTEKPGVSFHEEAKQAFNNLDGTASLAAEDLASDPAAQPSSGLELSSLPSHPRLGIPVRKTCLALVSD
jgi:hypothetical protein